ncbi:MAG: hypothetical protein ACQET1_07735, partial [Gemmatimonadota bacterium]
MNEKRFDELMMELRDSYNRPPDTPREEMWAAIQPRLGEDGREERVVSLEKTRRSRWVRIPKTVRWSMAAAALLVLGLGIGRMTAPGAAPRPALRLVEEGSGAVSTDPRILRTASVEHLQRTESLLTLVRAEARVGRVEPTMGNWARQLLSQTRLLMDAQPASDPVMEELLKDLELVLVQIVGVSDAPPEDR